MEDTRVRTVLERMTGAGISEERARTHIAAGRVRIGDDTGIHLDPA